MGETLPNESRTNELLDEIFEKALRGPRIFNRKSVLFHDHIPQRLLFREEQVMRLGYLFSSILRDQRSSNLFIYGKPGTGKTAVTRLVLNKLIEKSGDTKQRVHASYINCRMAGTEYRVAAALARDVDLEVPFTGLAVKEVFERFKTNVVSKGLPLVVVLDEVDALVSRYGDDLLYGLTRMNDRTMMTNVMVVGISNDVRFKEYLDPRVLSSLGEEEMVFKPYTPKELEKILLDRIPEAFMNGVVLPEAVALCSAISGSEHGDARKALDLLRVAGELAERMGLNHVEARHVHEAQECIDQNRVVEVVRSLPLHSKLVLIATLETLSTGLGRMKSMHIYSKYATLAKDFAGRVLSTRRFYGLIKELDVLGILDRRIENFGRRGGRVTTVGLSIPSREIRTALAEDAVVGEIFQAK
jgi:cell division control protein 6